MLLFETERSDCDGDEYSTDFPCLSLKYARIFQLAIKSFLLRNTDVSRRNLAGAKCKKNSANTSIFTALTFNAERVYVIVRV
jgi:hypothetical protein